MNPALRCYLKSKHPSSNLTKKEFNSHFHGFADRPMLLMDNQIPVLHLLMPENISQQLDLVPEFMGDWLLVIQASLNHK